MGQPRHAGQVGQLADLEGGWTGQGEAQAREARLADAQANHFAEVIPLEGFERLIGQGEQQVGGQLLGLLVGHLGRGR